MNGRLYEVIVQAQAHAQILEHFIWLRQRTVQHADAWLDAVYLKIGTLELWPKSHPVAEESEALGCEVRKMPHGAHVILFTVDDAARRVEILAVRPGARRTFGE